MALSEFDKLIVQAEKGKPIQQRGGKAKYFFKKNIEKILHLSTLGVTYKEIHAAIKLDGVEISFAHFKRLMAQAKKDAKNLKS